MSLTDQIQELCKRTEDDSKYKILEEALQEYHQLIDEGWLKPRENSLLNNYTTFIAENRLKHSNINV